jgi:hypothetical protein
MLILRLVCLLVCLISSCMQLSTAQTQALATTGPFELARPGQRRAVVPVQVQRNLLVVVAYLNGRGPYNFLLDTGVGTAILTSAALADSMQLRHGAQFRIVGAGGSDSGLIAYQTDSVRVTLPGIVAPHMTWLVLSEDVLNLSGYVGVPIHGILGSELFRSFVVTLQPEQGRIVLTPPHAYLPPKGRNWSSIPLHLENNKAYITAPVQLTDSLALPLKLVLDTGASHALSLELDSDPRLVAPAQRLNTDLGRGLTGLVQGYLGRVLQLQLGHTLRSVLTSYPNSADVHRRIDVPRNGNIGYELLKRFSIVVDYPHQRMLLRPNAHFHDAFEHDMCGIEFVATGPDYHRFIITRIMPDSPAAEAGLEPDEELVSVNFIHADTFTLTQLSQLFRSEDGRLLLLILRRPDGALHFTAVRLKRQI